MKKTGKSASVGIAELKAKLASYVRRVKSGDKIEILERGVPVAMLQPIHSKSPLGIIPSRSQPEALSIYRFSVHPKKSFDVTELLFEDRKRR